MFAITGITGQVGGAVASRLLDQKLPVRAVVRDTVKGKAWQARGADLAIAEMTDADALTKAFSGTEAVFLLIPPTFDPTPGFPEVRAVIAALKTALLAAQPQKVVCLSTIGAQARQPNLLNQLGLVEQALSDLPMPIAFLRAAWFIENAAWDVAPARENGVISSFLQPLDKPVPMVAVDDIGALGAELLQEEWRGRRIVELEGPARITPNDLAKAFADALGRSVTADVVPRQDWETLFRQAGMNNPEPRMQMLDGFNEGWIEFEGEARKGKTSLKDAVVRLVSR